MPTHKAYTFASHTSPDTDQSLQKSVLFPCPKKLKNKKFPSLQKNKTSQTHNPRQTDTNIHGRYLTAQYLRTLHGVTDERTPACNSTYPKGGVSCSKDSLVVNGSLVFQIKFCGKSPALRVAANRQTV